MVYRGAQVWKIPFCLVDTQRADSKSDAEGDELVVGEEGPKLPESRRRPEGERRRFSVSVSFPASGFVSVWEGD